MDNLEMKYMTIKSKIHNLSQQSKDYKKVLNETASVLLNGKDEYEFQTHNLVILKPQSHSSKKKSKD